jgi:2,4-dienoyl-CoA reductase-like NADH-dependent reductase (Old Yellow Enzyme family)
MSKLFSPYTIKDVTFRNRIGVSPMCQYSSEDGFANDWHLVHLGSRAVGGAGLVIVEATAVSPEGRITPADLGIWKDEHIEQLKRIASFINEHGAVAGIQLAHAGRKASKREPWNKNELVGKESGGWQTVAPSPIPFDDGYDNPKELSTEEIKKVIDDFSAAAERALHSGFKVVEIHAAHGYLLHEFLSPFSNERTDEYGGSFENRIKILLEVIAAVKKNWPSRLPLLVRISASEWQDGGWTIDDSISLAKILKDTGVDLLDCSSGGNIPGVKIPLTPGYQVPFAQAIRKEAGIATAAVGLITNAQQAEYILVNEQADMVFLARELLWDPYFPLHAAKQLNHDYKWPVQYERAKAK